MAKIDRTVKCSLSGSHWILESTGGKRLARGEVADLPRAKFHFNKFDPDGETFISIRECQGGRRGLPEINTIKLVEAAKLNEYQDLIASLSDQRYLILKTILPE